MYCGYGKTRALQNIEEEWKYIEPITNPHQRSISGTCIFNGRKSLRKEFVLLTGTRPSLQEK
jgi:hypothetical protein